MADMGPFDAPPRWPLVIAVVIFGAFASVCIGAGFAAGMAVDRCEVVR